MTRDLTYLASLSTLHLHLDVRVVLANHLRISKVLSAQDVYHERARGVERRNYVNVALEDLQTVWGVGPYRSERFGNEILDSLDSKKNTKLLKLSRKKGMVRFGMRIDKAMKRLEKKENGSQNIRVSRTQPKLKAVNDDDDDCSLPLPKYVAYSQKSKV